MEMKLICLWVVAIDLILVWGIGIDLVLLRRSKMTCFSVCIEINSVFVSGHRNRLDIEWKSKLTSFQ